MPEHSNNLPRPRRFTGFVVRDKNEQTIVVQVPWLQKHRLYNKARKRIMRLVAHDAENTAKLGDRVTVEQCRPFSATKRWRLIEVVEKKESAKQ